MAPVAPDRANVKQGRGLSSAWARQRRRAQVHIEGRGALCQVNIGLDAIMSQAEYPGVSV